MLKGNKKDIGVWEVQGPNIENDITTRGNSTQQTLLTGVWTRLPESRSMTPSRDLQKESHHPEEKEGKELQDRNENGLALLSDFTQQYHGSLWVGELWKAVVT